MPGADSITHCCICVTCNACVYSLKFILLGSLYKLEDIRETIEVAHARTGGGCYITYELVISENQ